MGTDAAESTERKCPYCGTTFSIDGVNANHSPLNFESYRGMFAHGGSDRVEGEKEFTFSAHRCPKCKGQIVWLNELSPRPEGLEQYAERTITQVSLLYPKFATKSSPPDTPADIARSVQEAWAVLELSPKASAALSRRCLQDIIRRQEGMGERRLVEEIRRLLVTNKLPKSLAEDLDAIRVVGNFASHPVKDTNTGEIVEVEPHEAEWTFEVLEELVRFYYEREPMSKARREALRLKAEAAKQGKLLEP